MDYTKIKELKLEKNIGIVNELIKKEWILVTITSIQSEITYLLGRV